LAVFHNAASTPPCAGVIQHLTESSACRGWTVLIIMGAFERKKRPGQKSTPALKVDKKTSANPASLPLTFFVSPDGSITLIVTKKIYIANSSSSNWT
jgi:hypothetical protein